MEGELKEMVERLHPDAEYIVQDEIGKVICKGLAAVAKGRPERPVEYLAKWLLRYHSQNLAQRALREKERKRDEAVRRKEEREAKREEEKTREEEEAQRLAARIEEFERQMGSTDDLVDLFDELSEYLKEMTGATGVYVGRLEKVKKGIKEEDNDGAHVEESAPQIISYISSTKDHSFMVGQSLKMSEGVTPDVFAPPPEPAPGDPAPDDPKDSKDPKDERKKEGAGSAEAKAELKNVVYRKEVTREPRMKYFKVPRLGCYFAIPLIYSSCLNVEALENALKDYGAFHELVKKNEEMMKEYEEKVAEEKAAQEAQEEGEEKKEEGEEQKLSPPELQEAKEPEYQTQPLSYVVCLDTLGQDREFTLQEQGFVLDTISKYKSAWELREKQRLTSDRKLREQERERENEVREKELGPIQEEEDKKVEEQMGSAPADLDEDGKQAHEKLCRYKAKLLKLLDGTFNILVLNQYSVVQYPRIMQSVFYLLGYSREEICESDTNKLFWKKAKLLWTEELVKKLEEYSPVGPRQGSYKKYQTINFIEKNLEGVVEEDVEKYSLNLSRLFGCLQMGIELRKEDIARRKERRERLTQERDDAIEKEKKRNEDRAEELRVKREELLAEWKEEQQKKAAEKQRRIDNGETVEDEPEEEFEFNEEEFLAKWDISNPSVNIPPEVQQEFDDDFDFATGVLPSLSSPPPS